MKSILQLIGALVVLGLFAGNQSGSAQDLAVQTETHVAAEPQEHNTATQHDEQEVLPMNERRHAAYDPFFASIKPDDIVFARSVDSSSLWTITVKTTNELTDEDKKDARHCKVLRVTGKAIQLKSLNGSQTRWIPWHAVYTVVRFLPVPPAVVRTKAPIVADPQEHNTVVPRPMQNVSSLNALVANKSLNNALAANNLALSNRKEHNTVVPRPGQNVSSLNALVANRSLNNALAANNLALSNRKEHNTVAPRQEQEVLSLQQRLTALAVKELALRDAKGSADELAEVRRQMIAVQRELKLLLGDAPSIGLQAAIQLAEDHAKAHKIDLSKHYLASARLISNPEATCKRAWEIVWDRDQMIDDDEIEFIIAMDKSVTRRRRG